MPPLYVLLELEDSTALQGLTDILLSKSYKFTVSKNLRSFQEQNSKSDTTLHTPENDPVDLSIKAPEFSGDSFSSSNDIRGNLVEENNFILEDTPSPLPDNIFLSDSVARNDQSQDGLNDTYVTLDPDIASYEPIQAGENQDISYAANPLPTFYESHIMKYIRQHPDVYSHIVSYSSTENVDSCYINPERHSPSPTRNSRYQQRLTRNRRRRRSSSTLTSSSRSRSPTSRRHGRRERSRKTATKPASKGRNCELCQKYIVRRNYRLHAVSHLGPRKYLPHITLRCTSCDMGFDRTIRASVHLATKHPDDPNARMISALTEEEQEEFRLLKKKCYPKVYQAYIDDFVQQRDT